MCGIFGFAGFDADGLLERMAATLVHRGPDGEGFLRRPNFAMGMRRLSIIDLEGGGQPIWNEDRTLAVCCNGEIYNYVELRDELRARGHVFRTRCDTEVIVHAYEEWGEEFLSRLNGMFALCIHDDRDGSVFLARDRCGQKPLYYWSENGRFVFASEVKAILACSLVSRECNVAAIDPYLCLRYVPEPQTMFRGIWTLPAAHWMRIVGGIAGAPQRWWRIELGGAAPRRSDADYLDELESTFFSAVELCLRSDVPVGAYLSAGVDSSLVVAAMRRFSPRIETFCLGFGSPYDESAPAERTSRLLGTTHHEVDCRPQDFALLPKVVYQMDRPVGDALIVAFYKLAEAAARRVKVVLSGEGADEMYAGYSFHKLIQLVDRYHRIVPGAVRRGVVQLLRCVPERVLDRFFDYPATLGAEGKARLIDFVARFASRDLAANYVALKTLWPAAQRSRLYAGALRDGAGDGWMRPARDGDAALLDRLLELQYGDWLQDWSLIRQDKNTMAHSLELRLPWLDHRLIEQAFRMPPRLKARMLADKVIERRLAARLLPREVVKRRKHPFALPMEFFFDHPQVQDLVRMTLDPARVRRRGYFDPAVVAHLVESVQAREFVGLKQVMALVILELWHIVFIDGESP